MRIVIIEDEQLAAQRLERLLHSIDSGIEVSAKLESVEAAVNWLSTNPHPDLFLMDIQLEDGLCFEIFENCNVEAPVIFTTAYDEYSLQAFKVNSVDYLLKPISEDELKAALDKFSKIHQGNLSQKVKAIQSKTPVSKKRFLVKVGSKYKSIPTQSISCFFIREKGTYILSDEGKNYAIDYSLEKVEKVLDKEHFFRINRHLIIHQEAVKEMLVFSSSRLKIQLNVANDLDDVMVSRERVAAFKEWMDR